MAALKHLKPKFYISPLITFSFVMAFVSLGDAIMAYTVPVYLTNYSNSTIFMGFVMACSSLFGICMDFIISERFWNRNYVFFTKATLIITMLFPLTLLFLPPQLPIFLLGMCLWGAYYEYRGYSMFNFINNFLEKKDYTYGWSILNSYKATAYFIGSLIAGQMIYKGFNAGFISAAIAFLPAIVIFIFSKNIKKSFVKYTHKHVLPHKRTIVSDFKILRAIMHKIWPMFLFAFMILLVDACFWTIGTLLSEEIKHTNKLGAFLLVAYLIPPMFSEILTKKIKVKTDLKKTAFMYGLLAAVFLVGVGTTHEPILLIIYILLLSAFLNIAFTLQEAVMEEYMTRLKQSGHVNDIVTLEQLSGSFAYFIGPIALGILAHFVGYIHTFAITGILLALVSFICFIDVPNKIKMPQKELRNIDA